MAKLLEFIEIQTDENVEYSIIWMHGLGASGHDFEPIVPELKLSGRPGVRFLFPHAPIRPITVNGGAAMRAWYDINSLDFEAREQDNDGIGESVIAIDELIQHEIDRGIQESNIVLAGFSQGGAIALKAGLTLPRKIAGIVALSTYLPMSEMELNEVEDSKLSMPIFMAHGDADDVIQMSVGEKSQAMLKTRGASIEWHTYSMPHSVSMDEVNELSVWFKRLFGM